MLERFGTRIALAVERRLGALAVATARHAWATLVCLALITAVALIGARRLALSTDLMELLPDNFESVRNLERIKENFGGFGYVVVVARNAPPHVLQRFANDVAPKLEKLPTVRYVDYRRSRDFLETHGLYYFDADDLQTINARLKERVDWEKRQENPLYIDLEESEPPSLDFADLQAKYEERGTAGKIGTVDSDYYLDRHDRMLAVFVKPNSVSADLSFSRRVVDDVKAAVGAMDLSSYPDLEIVYAGSYTKRIDLQDLITRDLQWATVVAALLILAYLIYHFRSAPSVVMLFVPLALGVIWSYALATVLFGTLNILTGFIGAILLGLGIDHGIHLLDRFSEEWAGDEDAEAAIRQCFANTGRSVVVASLTTLVGFAGLSLSDFRAFHEFGIVAALGMLLLIIAYLAALPALLHVSLKLGWRPHRHRVDTARGLAAWLPRHAGSVVVVSLVAAAVMVANSGNASFNYDTRALVQSHLQSFQLDNKLDGLLGYSMTPVVLFTRSLDEEKQVLNALRQRKRERGADSLIDMVLARSDMVPEHQAEKRDLLRTIGATIEPIKLSRLAPDDREDFRKLKNATQAEPFGYEELPKAIRQQFEGIEGKREESFVLVFANVDLSDGLNSIRFAKEVRNVPLPDGRRVSATGESMIMADVFDMVSREAPPVMLITLLLVALTMWVLMASLRRAALSLMPALITVFGAAGLLPWLGMEFNTLNIVMVPVLLGIGVDGGVHVISRFHAGAPLPVVISETGRAVMAALLTTALGFGSMLIADHSGLQSVAHLALVGLAINYLCCVALIPALLAWRPGLSGTMTSVMPQEDDCPQESS